MKHTVLVFSALLALILPVQAGERANTVLIHPGETVYARFEVKGKKLKLVSTTKARTEDAKVIFALLSDEKKGGYSLKVENKYNRDLRYKVEMRSLTRKLKFSSTMTPVVAGKLAFESFPKEVEELAAFDFSLEE